MTNQEKLKVIMAKIKKQKIGTIPELLEYSELFCEYVLLSKKIDKKMMKKIKMEYVGFKI